VIGSIGDFSRFNKVADRMQQGFLNMLMLGRLMIHPEGLSSNPAFQKNGRSVIDTRRLSSTATARAPSWAARSPRWRRTSSGAC
jgi:hypothetical protein